MHSKLPVRYLFIPFLYVAIIAVLLYAQFSGTSRIRLTAGEIELTAIVSRGSVGPAKTSDIVIRYASTSFPFGEVPLTVVSTDGTMETPALAEYRIEEDDLTLTFSSGAAVSFSGGATDEVVIIVSDGTGSSTSIGLPVSPSFRQPDSRVPFFTEGSTVAVAPFGTSLDADRNLLVIPLDDSAATVTIARTEGNRAAVPLYAWLAEQYAFPSPREVDVLRNRFLDRVYAGWVESRFSPSESAWTLADRSVGFGEDILVDFISESISRGTFRSLYPRILQIARSHAARLTHHSAPLLGNVVSLGGTIQAEDQRRTDELRTLLESSDPSVFTRFELVPFVFDRAPSTIADELTRVAMNLRAESSGPAEAVGAVRYLLDASRYDKRIVAGDRSMLRRYEETVLPFLAVTRSGLYLTGKDGRADIDATLRAGLLLEEMKPDEEILESISLALVRAGLSHIDSAGFLPAHIDPASGVPILESRLAPEPIYRLLSRNPYRTREISLYTGEGPGAWLWTAAGNVLVEVTDETYTISFDFPVGSAHHVIVRGIEPFRSITMFGIPWKNDPLFQNYTSGWTRDAGTNTLYMKVTHRSVREEIVIER